MLAPSVGHGMEFFFTEVLFSFNILLSHRAAFRVRVMSKTIFLYINFVDMSFSVDRRILSASVSPQSPALVRMEQSYITGQWAKFISFFVSIFAFIVVL